MDIELQLAVENLLARYVHALDDDRLEEWPGFFVENGCYRITTADNHEHDLPLPIIYADSRAMLRDRVSALRHASIYEAQRYRHTVSSTLVERQDANTARAVSHFQVLPKGVMSTELVWTCFGYANDDETMAARRMRQANLIGPAGYISLEDGAATGFVQRGVQGAPERAAFIEMGGDGVASGESRVSETSVRGFWQAYRRHMEI